MRQKNFLRFSNNSEAYSEAFPSDLLEKNVSSSLSVVSET